MRRLLLLTALLTLIVPAAAAHAKGGGWQQLLIEACRNGRITHHYSQADYRKAIANLPTDANEYTNCSDVLRQGQLAAAGGGRNGGGGGLAGGGGTGGGLPPGASPLATATPAEKQALTRAIATGAKPVSIAGKVVNPGRIHLAGLTGAHGLPTSLLAALILLALGGAGTAAATVIQRVRARRSS